MLRKQVIPEIRTEGKNWILRVEEGSLTTAARTLSSALQELEERYAIKVKLPLRYKGFTELPPEEFNMTVDQAGG